MANLEEALRAAAEKGMTHFTMWPTPSADGKTTYWRAQATPSTVHSYVSVSEKDPVSAALKVLQELPAARRRKPAKKEAVTATVTESTPATEDEDVSTT